MDNFKDILLNTTLILLLTVLPLFTFSQNSIQTTSDKIETQPQQPSYDNNQQAGKYYSVRGIKMYCEIYGEGAPLLLIHKNGGNIKSFDMQIPYFSKKYKVIIPDSRAQGRSAGNSRTHNGHCRRP